MSVIVDEFEISSSISPDRCFKAYVLHSDSLLPKVVPIVKSCETILRDGGVGSIRKLTFHVGDRVRISKYRVDVLDETNRVFKFSEVEGGDLGEEFESITHTVMIEPGPNGGSVYKWSNVYYPKSDNHHKMQETIMRAREGTEAFFYDVEAHLHANPYEYN